MRQDWEYRVTVWDGDLLYEGRFVRFCYAQKIAVRKLSQYKGTGALVTIYGKLDGTKLLYVA